MGAVALGAAAAALALYVLAAVWLAVQRSAGEPDWTRGVYIVTGVELVRSLRRTDLDGDDPRNGGRGAGSRPSDSESRRTS